MSRSIPRGATVLVAVLVASWIATVPRASADTLQASAYATSVRVTLTLASGAFPPFTGASPAGIAHIEGGVPGQSYDTTQGGGLFVAESVGPTQVSDPITVSMAESVASVLGTIDPGRTTLSVASNPYATASSAFAAYAEGDGGTRGMPDAPQFLPFSQATSATFDIDLISDYGANPSAAYSLQTSASGAHIPTSHSARAVLSTVIESNIPGAHTIFDLGVIDTWQNGSPSLSVPFFSPLIAQPILSSDFIAGPNGSYSLDPSKRHISIPFTIPAGLAFQFSVRTDAGAELVPEPSALALAGSGLLALAVMYRRRAVRTCRHCELPALASRNGFSAACCWKAHRHADDDPRP